MEYLSAIQQEATATSAAASMGLTAPIARYPGWTVLDLVTHTGGVHRWVTALVRERSQERIPRRSYHRGIPPGQAIDWFETGAHELVATLETAGPETAVWSLSDDRTVAFWRRRMAHETSLHRWDVQLAQGAPMPIDPDLAVSALEEALDIYVTRRISGQDVAGNDEALLLRCRDRPTAWRMVFHRSTLRVERLVSTNVTADATVLGGASDLWLFVMGRLPISAVETTGSQLAKNSLMRVLSFMKDASP